MKKRLKIPFAKVVVGDSERKYLQEVLDSGWLTTASKTLEFEEKFSKKVHAKYACAVNSCTAALHLGLDALGVKPGNKVFVPSMTFTASAEVIRYLNADPIVLDTEYRTNLISPKILEEAINENPDVKYLIIVHFGGQPAQMNEIKNLCHMHDIKILEDAAHAFPAHIKGQMVGSFGEITCFSFYANKTITTGEGGMLVTDDEEIYKRVKMMRLHGISRDVWDRFTSDKPSWDYDVIEAGYKYNMPDVNAAIGLGQLEKADEFRYERQKVVEFYYENLSNIDSIDLPISHVKMDEHAWHLFPIILNENSLLNRNEMIEKMSRNGIMVSVHYRPLHQLTYYREKYNLKASSFPNSEKTWQGTISLPLFPYMKKVEMEYVCNTVQKIFLD